MSDSKEELEHLQLLHLADSALPIGALAHSFGLESLVAQGFSTRELPEFLRGYLEEAGVTEAAFCREGLRLTADGPRGFHAERWVDINNYLSAFKPARESRAASASLGQNFLTTVAGLGDFLVLTEALRAAKSAGCACHYSPSFGLAAGALGLDEDRATAACLHQLTVGIVSACQRLLPLGQSAATKILWDVKPVIVETAECSVHLAPENACCFMPLLDWGAMEHPALTTRLFVS